MEFSHSFPIDNVDGVQTDMTSRSDSAPPLSCVTGEQKWHPANNDGALTQLGYLSSLDLCVFCIAMCNL